MIGIQLSDTAKNATGRQLETVQLAIKVARETGAVIKRRAMRGEFATPPAPYAGEQTTKKKRRKRRFLVSEPYAQAAGTSQTVWASSQEFHRAIGGVPGKATGGMWDGLRARNFGTDGAILEFAGSSTGSRVKWRGTTEKVDDALEVKVGADGKVKVRQTRRRKRDENGKMVFKAVTKAQNRDKAAAVFRRLKVGLLQPTEQEAAAQVAAVTQICGRAVAATFGADIVLQGSKGDAALFRAITGGQA